MRVLIVEDSSEKAAELTAIVADVRADASIAVELNVRDAVVALESRRYDLIVLDLMLPVVEGSSPSDVSEEILRVVQRSSKNRAANLVAVTAYNDLMKSWARKYADAGVFLVQYRTESEEWRTTFRSIVARASAEARCDFVVICAREMERRAFARTRLGSGRTEVENGFDVQRAVLGEFCGRVILLPRAGLVDAACVTVAAVERYRPQLVAMSGVCAGVRERTRLGQVIVCEGCWEYQVGKYTRCGFEFEPYQSMVENSLRTRLNNLCRAEEIIDLMYEGFEEIRHEMTMPRLGWMVSGSAVVADEEVRQRVCAQHRKICGLEMELSALFRAVKLVDPSICIIAAKGVSDFGDADKSDEYHECASVFSARFVVEGMRRALVERW